MPHPQKSTPKEQVKCCIMTTSKEQQVCGQKHSQGGLLHTAGLGCQLTAKAKAKAARAYYCILGTRARTSASGILAKDVTSRPGDQLAEWGSMSHEQTPNGVKIG